MIVDSELLLTELAQAIATAGNWGSMAEQFIRAYQPSVGVQRKPTDAALLEELADAFENEWINTDWWPEMALFIRSFKPSAGAMNAEEPK